MRNSSVVGVLLVVLMGVLVAVPGATVVRSAPAEAGKPRTIGELAATRPAPDLTGLARRSHPGANDEDATESFWDILRLRSERDPKAVPVLTEILVDNAGTGRIHGYAAAQALFCIGGKQAAATLDKHLFELGEYNEGLGGDYVDHWNMAEPARSGFIGAYLLKSIGREVELAVEANRGDDGAIGLATTIKNVSAEPLEMWNRPIRRLYVRAKDGRYLVRREIGIGEEGLGTVRETWKAGETRTVTDRVTIQSADEIRKFEPTLPKDTQLVLQLGVVRYYVDQPGDYEAIVVVEQTPPTGNAKATLKHPWVGRAVSKPVAIRLMPPAGQ